MLPTGSLYSSVYSPRSGALSCIAERSTKAQLLSQVGIAIIERILSRPHGRPGQKHQPDVRDHRG